MSKQYARPDDSAFIDDGCTEPGYIKAVPGLHPEVRFLFRPTTSAQFTAFKEDVETKTPRAGDLEGMKLVAKQVHSWSFDRPVKVKSVAELKRPVFEKLFSICTNGRPSDEDPQWEKKKVESADGERSSWETAKVGDDGELEEEKSPDPLGN